MDLELKRSKLMDTIDDNSIVVLFSGSSKFGVGDERLPFSVDRNFYYFTNLDRENMVFIGYKINNEASYVLAIEAYDEMMAKWVGGRLRPQEASDISGIDTIIGFEDVDSYINQLVGRRFDHCEQISLYVDLSKQTFDHITDGISFANKIRNLYPNIMVKNVASACTGLRLVKTDEEIAKLRKAIAVTDKAIKNMMDHSHNGISENELEAHFDFVLKCHNCQHSFPSIIAGGKNATILHYGYNNQLVEDDALVLCDLGASYEYLNADITRCFPVNGKFSERQKVIYDIVLRANEYIISLSKPGVTLRELNNKLIAFYEKELGAIGLLENGKQVSDYYWHGVSHMLGLETHDVSLSDYKVVAGNVYTVEPGLYLEDEKIGIRIEDDILITEDGCEVLSKDIIKSIEDIEKYMAK